MVLVLLFMFCMNLFMESTGVQCKILFIDLFSIDHCQVAPNTGYIPFYTITSGSKFYCRDLEPLIEFAGSMDSLIKHFHAFLTLSISMLDACMIWHLVFPLGTEIR